MQWTVGIDDQRWLVEWSPGNAPPPGANHGSSGVCLTRAGVVLVSRDGEHWELPAGRPETGEAWVDTLHREVREEACCEVGSATLLGFTRGTCLEGPERGSVLVRAHWAVRAVALPWLPEHEMVARTEVLMDDLMSRITVGRGLQPAYEQIWEHARRAFGGSG